MSDGPAKGDNHMSISKSIRLQTTFLALFSAALLFTAGCGGIKKVSTLEGGADDKTAGAPTSSAAATSSEEESGAAMGGDVEGEALDADKLRGARLLDDEKKKYAYAKEAHPAELDRLAREEKRLYVIFFEYDSYILSDKNKDFLKKNSLWLADTPKAMIRLEGHADERGTEEYNLALGEKRTHVIKKYLMDLGIEAHRIGTISYGEMKPSDQGHDEEAWSKNRRVEFRVLE